MAICTYRSDWDPEPVISDKEVAEWLARARRVCGKRVIIEETVIESRSWFRTRVRRLYQVLWPVFGCEYQILNFYPGQGSVSSINTMVPAETVCAWLMGVCVGERTEAKEKHE